MKLSMIRRSTNLGYAKRGCFVSSVFSALGAFLAALVLTVSLVSVGVSAQSMPRAQQEELAKQYGVDID